MGVGVEVSVGVGDEVHARIPRLVITAISTIINLIRTLRIPNSHRPGTLLLSSPEAHHPEQSSECCCGWCCCPKFLQKVGHPMDGLNEGIGLRGNDGAEPEGYCAPAPTNAMPIRVLPQNGLRTRARSPQFGSASTLLSDPQVWSYFHAPVGPGWSPRQ